jgi:hypothetical protein
MSESRSTSTVLRPLIVVLAAAGLFMTVAPAAAAVIKGKVVTEANPLEGAVVLLFSSQAVGFQGKPDFQSTPTPATGEFRLEVPAGRYFLIARKSATGLGGELRPGDYSSYYGGNPVTLGAAEQIEVGISCSPIVDVGAERISGGTGIRGRVFSDGQPLDRARVILYQDAETIFRGMGYASALSTKTGDFSFNLEPGSYFVVARKRSGEDRFGPLAAGDRFAFAHDNPVEVKDGQYTVISLNTITKLENPKVNAAELSLGGTIRAGETTLEGIARDAEGKPVAGLYISAYRDSMMTAKPDFISRMTGADGRYVLNLSEGGEYFIGARNTLGGPAEKGDLLGRYEGSEDHSVVLKTSEKKTGIDITVEKVQ